MITKQDFWDRMQYLKVDSDGFVTERSEENVAEKQYELAKQMCTEYGQFIMESLGWFHPDNPPERNNKNSKELFELYLTENK